MNEPRPAPPPDFARTRGCAPTLTIGIPAYNRPELLAETLASIANQRGSHSIEVVVCDDGDRAETRSAVEACAVANIRYFVNHPPLGAVRNWNRCIELAAAPWVTILHEDDALFPWFLDTVVRQLRAENAAVAIRCVQGEQFTPPPEPGPPPKPTPYPAIWFVKGSMTPFPGVVFPRELALRIGGFDPNQGGTADHAFWYALARVGRFEVVRHAAAFYRVNPGQWTEREWPTMLRQVHLLRLRVSREQLPTKPRLGRWLARFYTARSARSYAKRFQERPAILARAQQFERMPFAWLPSGWVWAFLRWLPRWTR
jgi:glycosyltransferase involved in cell wall biosynthesis